VTILVKSFSCLGLLIGFEIRLKLVMLGKVRLGQTSVGKVRQGYVWSGWVR
jgi:hypothetical protein